MTIHATEISLSTIADWLSIVSFLISLLSIYLIGSIRRNIIANRRKVRLRALFEDIKSIPNDAVPLSTATKSKIQSLGRNLPYGRFPPWSSKNRAVEAIRSSIKSEDIVSIKEGIDDYRSHSEDL